MQRLDRPPSVDQAAGQPIEQLGMRRSFAQQTEIVGRAHEPRAKMPSPDAIHEHATGERMPRIDEPFGQLPPAAFRSGELRRWRSANGRRHVPGNDRRPA